MSVRGDMTISGNQPATSAMPPPAVEAGWPAKVELILSALDAGGHAAAHERRALPRLKHRVRGSLRLFTDAPGDAPRVLFTRDINARGLGFVTSHRLPLGYGGLIELPRPDGSGTVTVHCTLLRCREAAPGWYEGSVYFNREQPALVPGHKAKVKAMAITR